MATFPEADKRLYQNIFVCKDCKRKIRANQMKVIAGKISCRKCKSKSLRVVRKK